MTEQELKEFVLAHEADSPAELMLHRDRWPSIDMAVAVRCIQGRAKARTKLPLWYAEPGLLYPQSLSLEQCSSQATALYKQRFALSVDRVADLTGGLGVDSWSLSRPAASVDYFERSEELCACARHNFVALGRDNITVHCAETTPEMLSRIPYDTYSLIYLDPARRGRDGGRVYSLRDCEPDITALRPELLRIAPRILLKASPMADIRVLLSELPEASEVHILSSENECKEVLVLMLRDNAVPAGDIPITAVELSSGDNAAEFHFTLREENEAAADLAVPKIRRIIEVLPFHKAAIRDFRKKYPACSVTARNFPMTSEELHRRLGSAESDILRVLATTASDGSRLLIVSTPSI